MATNDVRTGTTNLIKRFVCRKSVEKMTCTATTEGITAIDIQISLSPVVEMIIIVITTGTIQHNRDRRR